ncbi:hypothetical protein [Spirosoma sp.]|uniref:hypothetical protein n=1 Tax=Spirosoma sp. TaxID=1899569 RepID=UPI003B3A2FC0
MALVCTQIGEWIQEKVTREVEEWIEKTEEVCEDWPWPVNWLCNFVTTFLKVITYVVDFVARWVGQTVCKIVVTLADVVSDVFTGVIGILGGIVTLKWAKIVDGLIIIATGIASFIGAYIRIVFLGDTIDFIITEIKKAQLKNHVRNLLEAKGFNNGKAKVVTVITPCRPLYKQ